MYLTRKHAFYNCARHSWPLFCTFVINLEYSLQVLFLQQKVTIILFWNSSKLFVLMFLNCDLWLFYVYMLFLWRWLFTMVNIFANGLSNVQYLQPSCKKASIVLEGWPHYWSYILLLMRFWSSIVHVQYWQEKKIFNVNISIKY
jgi:hypothetical protein